MKWIYVIFKTLNPSASGVYRFIWRSGRVNTMAATNVHLLTYLLTYLFAYLLTYLVLTCLLTYSVQQSPSWDAKRFSAVKFHAVFGTRRFIIAFAIARHLSLSWARSIHAAPLPIPFPEDHRNVILPGKPQSFKWFLSPRFHHHNHVYTSSLTPYVLHAPSISFFSICSPEQYLVRSADH